MLLSIVDFRELIRVKSGRVVVKVGPPNWSKLPTPSAGYR